MNHYYKPLFKNNSFLITKYLIRYNRNCTTYFNDFEKSILAKTI